MKVYHGGTSIIDHPDVVKGRAGLDFGCGFYVTDLKKQADDWADRMARIRMAKGVVSVYELDIELVKRDYSYKCFEEYDIEWLDFIVRNRRGEIDTWKYDIVEGGVANDRVIDTVEAYMSNLMPLETALQNLSLHRPNNQICIRSQHIVEEYLHYIESYNI